MSWEDCVVDVHSVKIPQTGLEEMFRKCGPLRSVIPWKGLNEKPHIFFEYKSSASTDAARIIGLEQNNIVQVIKIANSDMLKRKFRELINWHGQPRERDRHTRVFGRSQQPLKSSDEPTHKPSDRSLPARPVLQSDSAVNYRDRNRRSDFGTRGRSVDRGRSRSRTTRSLSRSRELPKYHRREERSPNGYAMKKSDSFESHNHLPKQPLSSKEGCGTSKSLNILHIPYMGEAIELDLDKHLDPDPNGIIYLLTFVRGDQKLWMIIAACYKGKQKLDAAKKVLEAGIDMAARLGIETDTKPYWNLLNQINAIIRTNASSLYSTRHSDIQHVRPLITHTNSSRNNFRTSSSDPKDASLFISSSPGNNRWNRETGATLNCTSDIHPLSGSNTLPRKPPPLVRESLQTRSEHSSQEISGTPQALHPVSSQLEKLQQELRISRQRQDSIMEELSATRAAKRRVEDDMREERIARRKLEKDLRTTEDALTRSRRLESVALNQVKREVEARRQAESLVKQFQTNIPKPPGAPPPPPNESSPAAVMRLLTLLRNTPNNSCSPMFQPPSNPSVS